MTPCNLIAALFLPIDRGAAPFSGQHEFCREFFRWNLSIASTFISVTTLEISFLGSAHKRGPLKRSRLPIADQCKHYHSSTSPARPFFTLFPFLQVLAQYLKQASGQLSCLKVRPINSLLSNGNVLRANGALIKFPYTFGLTNLFLGIAQRFRQKHQK